MGCRDFLGLDGQQLFREGPTEGRVIIITGAPMLSTDSHPKAA